jgi:flagellin
MKNVGLEQRRASNRLSSGYRINSAADDAAGLAISETMRAQIRGLDQASRNAQDGQAMILTTEGGLEEIGNMLVRVRELLVQASNDTNTSDQRRMIDQEINQLGREILSMQNRVEFNSNRVLAMGPAVYSGVIERVGHMEVASGDVQNWADALNLLNDAALRAQDLLSEMSMSENLTPDGAQYNAVQAVEDLLADAVAALIDMDYGGGSIIDTITHALDFSADTTDTVDDILVALGDLLSDIGDARSAVNVEAANIRAAVRENYDILRDFAMFRENPDHNIGAMDDNANTGQNVAFFQVGANSSQGVSFDFESVSRTVSAAGWLVRTVGAGMSAPGTGSGIGNGIDISPLIGMLDSSIADVNSVRANLGAVQNRMDFTMRSLDISSENLQDSESRVRNADVAREMMAFTMTNVLQQAAVSMLSQANQLPNNLLQLLR